jgi:hypothetical protein
VWAHLNLLPLTASVTAFTSLCHLSSTPSLTSTHHILHSPLGHSPLSLPSVTSCQVSYRSHPPWKMVSSRPLLQPYIYPHIIVPCHSTSDLSQCSACTFRHPHSPSHLPSIISVHMVVSRFTSPIRSSSMLINGSSCSSPAKQQTTKDSLP